MKAILGALLLCSDLLTKCNAKPVESDAIGFHQPLALDMDKEYSEADLKRIFAESTFKESKVELNVFETPIESEISKTSTELTTSKAWKPTHMDIRASASVHYSAGCWDNLFVKGNYKVNARFDGKKAWWQNALNIDGFKYISIAGHGSPYKSTAEYYHVVCQAPNSQTICTYYHFGILTADIHTKEPLPYIKLGAVQRSVNLNKYQQPWVIQTCKPIPKGVKKAPCPHPDPTVPENWCSLSNVDVTPY